MQFLRFGFAILLITCLQIPAAWAQSDIHKFQIAVTTALQLEQKDTLKVRQTVTVKNQTKTGLKDLEFALISNDAADIKVRYRDKTTVPFTVVHKRSSIRDLAFEHKSLVLDFPHIRNGKNRTWQFVVTYKAHEPVRTMGESVALVVPFLDGKVADTWRAHISVPDSLPDINYAPEVADIKVSSQNRRLSFRSRAASAPVLALSFTKSTTHQLQFSTELRNPSLLPRSVQLVLPPELHNQTVHIDTLSPRPDDVTVDRSGNVIATYNLLPFGSETVSVQATVRVRQLRYNPAGARSAQTDPGVVSRLVRPTHYWPTQGTIGKPAARVTKNDKTAWAATRSLISFVQTEITYDSSQSGRQPATTVLEQGRGNALGIADLLVAMLRSQDIPARLVSGIVYPTTGLSTASRYHTWVEAYIAGMGWMTLDPVWSETFGSFGYSSADRIGLLVVGDDEQSEYLAGWTERTLPVAAPTGKTLPPRDDARFGLQAQRYVILPGLFLDQTTLTNQSGYVIDDVALGRSDLGSVAPFETVVTRQWDWGGFAPFRTTATVDGETIAAVANRTWWPLWVLAAVGLIGGVVQFYRYRRGKYLKHRLHGKILH